MPLLEQEWNMIIAFPPCTYLSNAGSCRLFAGGELNEERYKKGLQGKEFFMKFFNNSCPRICIENPIAATIYKLPPYQQIVQPYEYGHKHRKTTCLWLKGLPNLKPTKIIENDDDIILWISAGKSKRKTETFTDSKRRSKFWYGIAEAMATQWGDYEDEPIYETYGGQLRFMI